MNAPLVSILVPVFNREAHVGECIESALAQSYAPTEIIAVDNASTDRSWEIIQALAARHPKIKCARNRENIGPVENWRKCLELASAPFAKVLFSDDLIHRDYLAKTVPFLGDGAVGFVFTSAVIGENPDHGTVTYRWPGVPGVTSSRRFVLDHGYGRSSAPLPVSPGAALFRTGDLRANLRTRFVHSGLNHLQAHGAGPDLLLYLLTARRYPKVAHLDEPLVFFRAHPDAITMKEGPGRLRLYYEAAMIEALKEGCPERYLRRYLSALWMKEIRQSGRRLPFSEFITRYQLKFETASSVDGTLLFLARSLQRRLFARCEAEKTVAF